MERKEAQAMIGAMIEQRFGDLLSETLKTLIQKVIPEESANKTALLEYCSFMALLHCRSIVAVGNALARMAGENAEEVVDCLLDDDQSLMKTFIEAWKEGKCQFDRDTKETR